MPRDVFEETPSKVGSELFDNSLDVGPEVSRVVLAFSLSRLGKRLAWISREQGVDETSPWSGVEGFDVVPDWSGVEVSGALRGDEGASGVLFPLDVAGAGKARLGKAKTHVKSAAACTEGEAVSGR